MSHGLKPWDHDSVEEAVAISRAIRGSDIDTGCSAQETLFAGSIDPPNPDPKIIDFRTGFNAIGEREQGLITTCGACGDRLTGKVAHLACGHIIRHSCMERHGSDSKNHLPPNNPMVANNVSCPRCGRSCSLWSEVETGGPEYCEEGSEGEFEKMSMPIECQRPYYEQSGCVGEDGILNRQLPTRRFSGPM